jgi:predicted MFS family arabinose efflux permease
MNNSDVANVTHLNYAKEITILFTGFIAATYGFGVYLFATVLPDMRASLGFSFNEAGIVMGAAQIGFLIAALCSGFLARKLGAERMIVGSVAVCCGCLFLVALSSNLLAIGLLLFVLGVTAATVWVPMVEVAQREIPKEHQAKALGLMSSGTAYGVFFNSLAVPWVLPYFGWRGAWALPSVVTSLLLLWAFARLRMPATKQSQAISGLPTNLYENTTSAQVLKQPITYVILAMMFLAGIACMPTQNYLISFMRDDLGHSLQEASLAWSSIGLVGMIGGFVMGTIADRFSIYKSLFTTLVLLTASIAAFLARVDLLLLYAASAMFGLAFNALFGLMPALVSSRFKGANATKIFGLGNVMLGLGSMTGNYMGGLTRELTDSFQLIHGLSFVSTILLIVLTALAARRPLSVGDPH